VTGLVFDNSYARLPERFFARVDPARPPSPSLIALNRELADDLGLDIDWLAGAGGLDFLSGRAVITGSEPIAAAYAGHQFANFVPQLGDGRAILLGEILDQGGQRRDIQLKGAGRTPFSRRGDGRAALGPVLREYLVSETMAALGIPTTRSLAAIATGEVVEREMPLPGATLVRVAASHVRVGTFQFFAARQDLDGIRLLADHVIARHYPEAGSAANPYRALLEQVVAAQADLIARWMLVGFIHGVMNTDNVSIAGETIDYGPCAFLDAYDPATVFSSIDRLGRYALGISRRSASGTSRVWPRRCCRFCRRIPTARSPSRKAYWPSSSPALPAPMAKACCASLDWPRCARATPSSAIRSLPICNAMRSTSRCSSGGLPTRRNPVRGTSRSARSSATPLRLTRCSACGARAWRSNRGRSSSGAPQ